MATVLDSFIIELGLDPSKFTKGQKEAVDSFKKTQDAAGKTAKDMEVRGAQAARFFSQLQTSAIKLFALFTAGKGIKQFLEDIISTEAATGRMAKVFGMSTQSLSAWQGVAKIAGGSAAGMAGSIRGLVQQFQTFQLTGESSVIPYFRALGINIADATGHMRSMDDILLDLADAFSHMAPEKASAFGAAIGLDEGTINVLLRGRDAVRAMLDEQRKLGVVSKEDAAAGAALEASWAKMTQSAESLGRGLLTWVTPAIVGLLDLMTKLSKAWQDLRPPEWITEAGEWLSKKFPRWGKYGGNSVYDGEGQWVGTKPPAGSDVEKLMGMGWNQAQAEGIAANLQRESRSDHTAVNGSHYGLAQWDPSRQADFAKWAGHDIRSSTHDEQLAFVNHELTAGKEQAAGRAIAGLTNSREIAAVISRRYERTDHPDSEAAIRAQIALGYAAAGTTTSTTSSRSSSTHVDTIIVNTQATDAAGVAAALRPAIERDSFATQANYAAN